VVFNAEISAAIQEGLSDALIALGRPFTAETVFSHPSKLELIDNAHAAGYTIVLHVLLIPEELAVHGVAYRGASRWNPVAENKIRERYHRLWALVADAITRFDQATVYDNSGIKGPRIVAQMTDGFIVGSAEWPHWTPSALRTRWLRHASRRRSGDGRRRAAGPAQHGHPGDRQRAAPGGAALA
jgi:predicted ABC-type ATPase